VEHGFTIPSVQTLEKFASGLEVPLYRFFYLGEEPPPVSTSIFSSAMERLLAEKAVRPEDARFHEKFGRIWNRMRNSERQLVLNLAESLASRKNGS